MPPSHTDEGLRAALAIRAAAPGHRASSCSRQYVEERYATELLAGDAAASATCSRTASPTWASSSTRCARVAAGGTALDPEVVAPAARPAPPRDPLDRLTPREREVLALMAEGRSNAAIADALVVSDGAVEKHVATSSPSSTCRPPTPTTAACWPCWPSWTPAPGRRCSGGAPIGVAGVPKWRSFDRQTNAIWHPRPPFGMAATATWHAAPPFRRGAAPGRYRPTRTGGDAAATYGPPGWAT